MPFFGVDATNAYCWGGMQNLSWFDDENRIGEGMWGEGNLTSTVGFPILTNLAFLYPEMRKRP